MPPQATPPQPGSPPPNPAQPTPPVRPPAPPVRSPATPRPGDAGDAPGTSKIIASYPDDPRIALAQKLLNGGKYEYARNILMQILKDRADVGRAEFFLGVSLVKMKSYELARPHLERSLQLNQQFPERKHAHHFMGWASYHLGELDRAKSDFEAHLAEVPDEPDSVFALGVIAFDEDRLDDAERQLQHAIDLQQGPKASKRDVAKAWIRLGDVSMRRDNAAQAEERFMTGLALFADHYEGWAKLARARDRLGKAKEAESARNEERRARARVAGRDPDAPTEGDSPVKDGPDAPPNTTPAKDGPTTPPAAPTPPPAGTPKPSVEL